MVRSADVNIQADVSTTSKRRSASDWLWRPWYAKLWWSAIPLWWTGMAASTQVASLERFYDGALAGFLNVLFFPLTVLMVLGVGYVQGSLAKFSAVESLPIGPEDVAANVTDLWEEHDRAFEDLNATTDMLDPRSGALYIGNPISSNNGARISAS